VLRTRAIAGDGVGARPEIVIRSAQPGWLAVPWELLADPTRPDPTRPDPTRPDPTRPDPAGAGGVGGGVGEPEPAGRRWGRRSRSAGRGCGC